VKPVGQQPASTKHGPSTHPGSDGKTVCNNKSHDFLLPKGPIGIGMAVQPRGTGRGQAVKEMPEPDRDKTDFG
jgi:hypothetical protein